MRKGFYARLAWTGIRKNGRLYVPYILTSIGMVMMFYIISFLNTSVTIGKITGGDMMQSIMSLGCGVIGFFALLFLFYCNSFLIRRRKKEFGLYNILGMGKWNLARVILWESFIITSIALLGGLLAGIALSKLAELGIVNILKTDVSFSMSVEPKAIYRTVLLFVGIFTLILIHMLWQIRLSNPVELLRSESTGEKPPRTNGLLAVAGVIILAFAYYLAVTIEDPITALSLFFIAVILVIIATYLLFIAVSVAFCRFLQKRKNYYYKTNHFVSVSTMVYRMKRNGAGLASICILSTMVLVMLSSTACLYIGGEDTLRARYPRHISLDIIGSVSDMPDTESSQRIRDISEKAAQEHGAVPENILDYRVAAFAGYTVNGRVETDREALNSLGIDQVKDMWQIFIVPLEDYNRLMGQEETLSDGEAMIYTTKSDYDLDTIAFGDGEPLKIRKTVPSFANNGIDTMQILPSLYIFVEDLDGVIEPIARTANYNGDSIVEVHWFYGYDLACGDETQIEVLEQLKGSLQEFFQKTDAEESPHIVCEGVAKERASFYGLFGGLFFLGILLGLVFVCAAVLIMYYKQISEGYEDQSRFAIMQKVGMTKKEIRKGINSQVLTVFFAPLFMAGLHLTFAFPLIQKMLLLFSMTNTRLLILVTILSYLLFALFYVLVYRITSRAYYMIVSGARDRRG